MKINLKNKTLLSNLSIVKGIVPSRPTFPIQSMVLISPAKGGCYLYTQGTEAQMRCFFENISISEPTKKLIAVSKIYEISRNFPDESDISLEFKDDSVNVSCEGSQYKLKSLPAEEFPLMTEPDKQEVVKLAERDLKNLIEKTDFCIASQDPRHYLNGLLFSVENKKLFAVSTDSHRLALGSLSASGGGKAEGILPREIVSEVKRLLSDTKDTVEISISPQKIVVSMKNVQISSKALNGQFPDYKKVIPKDFSIEIELEREKLLQSLLRASAISTTSLADEGGHVSLAFSKGELLVKSNNPDGEEAVVKQKIEYAHEPLDISFNSRYLQDVMRTLDTEKICLQVRDASSGVRIVGKNSTTEEYVVMPLRL